MKIMWFVVVLLLLEVFTYGLGRALQWLFAPVCGKREQRVLMVMAFALTNALILGLVFQLGHWVFRWAAGWMVVLLLVMYASLATFILHLLLKRVVRAGVLSRNLRVFAPLFFMALFGLAVYNAYIPTVRHASITLDKPMSQPLRIGMASDLHLGVLFGAKRLDQLAALMKRERVDVILLPGDLMDDDVVAYRAEHMQPHLQQLRAPLGIYATLGNHDLFGNQDEIEAELQKAGVVVLRNRVINVGKRFVLVGRDDDLVANRPSTAQLLQDVHTQLPIILMDHRPSEIVQNMQTSTDIQLSGHVHNGQVAPANLIVRLLYPLHYGYAQFQQLHAFVSSGFGFWGVPFRLGSQSEIWVIDVKGR